MSKGQVTALILWTIWGLVIMALVTGIIIGVSDPETLPQQPYNPYPPGYPHP